MKIFLSLLLLLSVAFASSDIQDSIADSFDSEYTVQKKENSDPIKGYNVFMTNLNDKFYTYILFPIAKGYKKIVPTLARNSVSNFFNNLFFPVRFLNNLLQLKIKNSFEETQRFVLNSTIGIAGLFDVAINKFHIKSHNEDFGQTLGYYGMGDRLYIVWPILGPSNLRDTIGFVGDYMLDPIPYINNRGYNLSDNDDQSLVIGTFRIINKTSFDYKKYKAIKKGNVVLYPILKNFYEKHRKKLIRE